MHQTIHQPCRKRNPPGVTSPRHARHDRLDLPVQEIRREHAPKYAVTRPGSREPVKSECSQESSVRGRPRPLLLFLFGPDQEFEGVSLLDVVAKQVVLLHPEVMWVHEPQLAGIGVGQLPIVLWAAAEGEERPAIVLRSSNGKEIFFLVSNMWK